MIIMEFLGFVFFFFKAFCGRLSSRWWIRYRKRAGKRVTHHVSAKLLGFARTPVTLAFFFPDGYSIGCRSRRSVQRLVSRKRRYVFVGMRGSEAPPQPCGWRSPSQCHTTRPRACRLILCRPALILPMIIPISMCGRRKAGTAVSPAPAVVKMTKEFI